MMKFFKSVLNFVKNGAVALYKGFAGVFLDWKTIIIWAAARTVQLSAPTYFALLPSFAQSGVMIVTAGYMHLALVASTVVSGAIVAAAIYLCAQALVHVTDKAVKKVAELVAEKQTARVDEIVGKYAMDLAREMNAASASPETSPA